MDCPFAMDRALNLIRCCRARHGKQKRQVLAAPRHAAADANRTPRVPRFILFSVRLPRLSVALGGRNTRRDPKRRPIQFAEMDVGDINRNGQELRKKTDRPSATHPYATVWLMRCRRCGGEYGSNSCDAHIRRCPRCVPGAAASEPLE